MSLGSCVPLEQRIFSKATRVAVRCSQGAIRAMLTEHVQEAASWSSQRKSGRRGVTQKKRWEAQHVQAEVRNQTGTRKLSERLNLSTVCPSPALSASQSTLLGSRSCCAHSHRLQVGRRQNLTCWFMTFIPNRTKCCKGGSGSKASELQYQSPSLV